MNLVVLTKQFGNYTGATISTIQLLKRINSTFDNVTVITLRKDKTEIKNVNVIVVKNYIALVKTLRRYKNVIGYSDDHLGFLFNLAGIKYIHTYHGNWPDARKLNLEMFIKSFYFMPLYSLTIKKAYKVISVSKYMQERFVSSLNPSGKIIYNGVKQKTQLIDTSLKSVKNSRPNFLMVGNIDARKYGKSIKIFNELKEKLFDGTIDIYGALLDKTLVSKLNTFDFINIKGVKDEINYNEYDGLICTSASENLPVSIIESLISKVPVISSNVGGIPEIVINNKTGYLIDVNNFKKFAEVILNYHKLNINDKYVNKIKQDFDWDTSSQLYKNIFENLGRKQNESNYSRPNAR
ncbi:glycosyltransferase family 4 protein [Limosilactobacillus vaginalis]|uniref:glycosyltransferase family 4 protein n=1 Tax=Limosilactobacillus vaginalis TaxID=1633 RepID=UPI0022A9DE1A|nr:glycosyltransferase [Limosilactobacillus vaginalis]MCZ2465783.1 glycosyltransferase [Limosilactobacillus vaginalis]